jgi:hypothetical protein
VFLAVYRDSQGCPSLTKHKYVSCRHGIDGRLAQSSSLPCSHVDRPTNIFRRLKFPSSVEANTRRKAFPSLIDSAAAPLMLTSICSRSLIGCEWRDFSVLRPAIGAVTWRHNHAIVLTSCHLAQECSGYAKAEDGGANVRISLDTRGNGGGGVGGQGFAI